MKISNIKQLEKAIKLTKLPTKDENRVTKLLIKMNSGIEQKLKGAIIIDKAVGSIIEILETNK